MKRLTEVLKKDKTIKNFRAYKIKNTEVALGIEGKLIGGPYFPIQSASTVGGELQIQWTDGKVSFTNITSSSLETPKEALEEAKKIKIVDNYAKKFLKPYKIENPVNQYSKDTSLLLSKKQNLLVEELKFLKKLERDLGRKKHEMQLGVSESSRELINSKGLTLSDSFSNYAITSNWDSKVYFTLQNRRFFHIKTFKEEIGFLAKLYRAANNPLKIKKFLTKKIKVILSPETTWDLLSFFLFSNLKGSLVANKMSRFSKEDFKKNKKILANWLTLKVNPLKELTPGASNFTSEGVKSKITTFIDKGRLVTPILDLKHAQKLKMEPTIAIGSSYTTTYSNNLENIAALKKCIEKTKEGLLIFIVLGLHTQNQMTGDYSLPSPYSIYIKDGEPIGSLKTIVIGNIFKDLNKKVDWVETDFLPTPGMCYNPNVIIE